jgi:hypothetical protein
VEAIIVKTLETTPKGRTHWSTRTMAAQIGVSHTMVGRIWRTFGLKPHRTLSLKLSPDFQLVAKIRDIVGLYMKPPANATVFAVDEESQIQALQRAQPILPMMDFGQPERRTHNYVRHGTLDLFAALDVVKGTAIARCKRQHRSVDFIALPARNRLERPLRSRHSRHRRQSLCPQVSCRQTVAGSQPALHASCT